MALSPPIPQPKPKHNRGKPKAKDRGEITPEVAAEVKRRSGGCCEMCGLDRPTDRAWHLELAHLVGKGQCGRGDQPWNVAHLCSPSTNTGTCHNLIDHNRKTYREWVEQKIAELRELYNPADWPGYEEEESMQAEAIAKLKAEMEADTQNSYVQVIGEFLIGHIGQHPEVAEKILDNKKSIGKSLSAMEAAAKKKKQPNGTAMLTPAEGYGVVLNYFGIKGVPNVVVAPVVPVEPVTSPPPSAPAASESSTAVDFDVSFDDF
ncbi:HNH endonuclease [Tumebacillus permanentifrigoris]|uniref:Uncharacterized protein n=1 Tax=Tumebacillus permanentifrigoris TaxID=378543 RepID=A0A316D325_9BACL|nr:hypothetical protein [Tumebacillus permanentifrigoris]PWK05264.1 hypothetical protein C7459_12413 [Tumebacillus permanentifrigoris]